MKTIVYALSLAVLAGCAAAPKTDQQYMAEASSLNDVEACYMAHYGPTQGYMHPVPYLATKSRREADAAKRISAAQQVVASRAVECDLIELAKLREMRKQSAIMEAGVMSSPAQQPRHSHSTTYESSGPSDSDLIMRCGSKGRGVDFVTKDCM